MAWYRMKRFRRMVGISKKRKGASKSDNVLDNEDAESDISKEEFVSRGKMSLLSSTSFCCTSGQKEDYASDAKFMPRSPRKKQPVVTVVAKRDVTVPSSEAGAPSSPLVAAKRGFLARNKQRKSDRVQLTDCPAKDVPQIVNGSHINKLDHQNQHGDNRLRPPEDKKKGVSTPQQRRSIRDPAHSKVDNHDVRQQKYTEVMRKLRKDSTHYAPSNITSLNMESNKLFKRNNKVIDSCSLNHSDKHEMGGLMDVRSSNEESARVSTRQCDTKKRNETRDMCLESEDTSTNEVDHSVLVEDINFTSVDTLVVKDIDVSNIGILGDTATNEEFDCPCCEKEPLMDVETDKERRNEMENRLQAELLSLRADLEAERARLEIKHRHVLRLEKELAMMDQLKQQLLKEQELRKKTEDQLQEMLEDARKKELLENEKEKRTESKATQKNDEMSCNPPASTESSSPLLLGYESRVRRYQSYIAKLEKDNQMLINELKKFKDLSPRSQEQQAKELLEKLDKLEQDNRQQQLQYESCLDEVANKLVHTLLVQKRLEEECKVLHLRVEQLEQENENLKELTKNDAFEKIEKLRGDVEGSEETEIKAERKISHCPEVTSPIKHDLAVHPKLRLSDKRTHKEAPKCPKNSSNSIDMKSPVTSPTALSSKSTSSSKIPSFGVQKPPQTAQVRKKTKTENSIPKPNAGDLNCKNNSMSPTSHVPNPSNVILPFTKNKHVTPADGSAKAAGAKRKRTSRNASPVEKDGKESKQRLRSSHQVNWDHERAQLANLVSSNPTSPSGHFSPSKPSHHIWSFNCTLQDSRTLESPRKVAESLAHLEAKAEAKTSTSTDDSSTNDTGHKTRDEGYSTMSSDLQPDSTTDSTVSEHEDHSSTYHVSEKVLRCTSNDSVTECFNGSMSSSSDSGFGPLRHVVKSKAIEQNSSDDDNDHARNPENNDPPSFRNHATVKIRGPITSGDSISESMEPFEDDSVVSDAFLTPTKDRFLKDLFTSRIELQLSDSATSTSCLENGAKWLLQLESKITDGCKSVVETAEKATLTEPEEETWREKALAHFIDESIWSLYSSENEIEVKPYPLDPDRSLEDLIDSPCIIVTELEDDSVAKSDSSSDDLNDLQRAEVPENRHASNGLERVASDTVLYLKDAIQELETSMMRGLKSSKNLEFKNVPVLQYHTDSTPTPEDISEWKPDLIRSLENAMMKQNNLTWPSPSRSSSTGSLQSSTSCHLISDETEDIDVNRTSRKGSQDPDLSSASDVEYENLEHKDFVEKWLRRETAHELSPNPKSMGTTLEPVGELGEWNPPLFHRKHSLPCDSPEKNNQNPPSRVRLMSYPTCSTPIRHHVEPPKDPFSPLRTTPMFAHEITELDDAVPMVEEFQSSVESETKEFNGDFYKLCSVGSLRSLDHMPSFKPSNLPKILTTESQDLNQDQCNADQREEFQAGFTKPSLWQSPQSHSMSPSSIRYQPFKPTDVSKPSQSLPITSHSEVAQTNQRVTCVEQDASIQKSLTNDGLESSHQYDKDTKATSFHKPTRPDSLVLTEAPRIPEHNQESIEGISNMELSSTEHGASQLTPSSELSQSVNTSKVPPSRRHSELRDSSMPNTTCLPRAPVPVRKQILPPSESSVWSKRQQWKRDRRLARQNRMKEGCGTSWIHLQDNPDLYDPKARASLLDSLRAPSSSSGSSSSDDEEEGPVKNLSPQQKISREKKLAVKRRPSIVDRLGLFYRFGEREQEAISYFDFLNDIPSSSLETLTRRRTLTPQSDIHSPEYQIYSPPSPTQELRTRSLSPELKPKMLSGVQSTSAIARRLRLPNLWNQPLSHNMSSSTLNSQDCEILDHISLSDSCAESYSSTPDSYEEAS